MTIEALAASHAISFHDAELVGLQVEYASNQLVLTVNVDVADPDQSSSSPEFRRSRLSFARCQFVVVDPPGTGGDAAYPGLPVIDISSPEPSAVPATLPSVAGECVLSCVFIYNWNTCIWISAADVRFEWLLESS